MNSHFGQIFLFLTDLAWKSRITIPILLTTVFLITDVRLQIEINIQTGQVGGMEFDELDDSDDDDEEDDDDDDEYDSDDEDDETTSSDESSVNENEDDTFQNNANRIRLSLGLS